MSEVLTEMQDGQSISVLEQTDSVQEERLARLLALCGSISDEDAAIMLAASKECRQDYGEW